MRPAPEPSPSSTVSDEMLKMREVLDQFKVSETQLHRWVKAGHFGEHRAKPHGKREPARLFSVDVLERLGAARRSMQLDPASCPGNGEPQCLEQRVATLTRRIEALTAEVGETNAVLGEVATAARAFIANASASRWPNVPLWLARIFERTNARHDR